MPRPDLAATAQTKPLEGFRVLEMAMYGSASSAGAVLAGWGADVIKIEHAASGEPGHRADRADRGKRTLGLDMTKGEGREVLYGLAARSDVFLTGFPPGARRRFGIDVADLRGANPRIIYATGTALDPGGLEEFGETLSGTNLAVGISAALLRRERTGEPSLVGALTPHAGDLTVPGPAQTDRILMDLGLGWDRIIALKASGAVT